MEKTNFKFLRVPVALAVSTVSVLACGLSFETVAQNINVYSAAELQAALRNASAGDEIVVYPGSYIGQKGEANSGSSPAHFYSDKSGTASNPIVLKSYAKSDKQTLQGDNVDSGYILYLTGDHWRIKDLKFKTAQKGIMLEGANYNLIDNVEVSDIGAEAVHFRQSSSHNKLTNCYIHNTGKRVGKEGFGEGVYVGTHNGHESATLDPSNYNLIGGCTIGPNVTAETFDVKSGTKGTVIESNNLSGKGIIGTSGNPAADSFIDLKGTDVIVRYNKMDWQDDNNLAHAIFTYQEHRASNIYENEFTLKSSSPIFKILEETVHAKNNSRLDNGTKVVEADYQLNKMDDQLDNSIEQPYQGPYSCFDELTNGCGSALSGTSPEDPEEPTDPNDGSTPTDPSGCDSTVSVSWNTKTEVTLAGATCVDFGQDLSGENLQFWDSDANSSCDFRGSVSSINGSGSLDITSNYVSVSSFSGTLLQLVANNGCDYIKVRAY
ncbi:right-handed parallel beta-helix repeat-containing protein [Catenovulum agarivorans]|uniref:right-handed parallel beta-helix repeat-containing protein n=1 Tax=Catenovulum agarivorans TaxID=1172192 RepID=UPI00031E1C4C|nr:right-handed parallel beta-helix repeat-containing protein [Catenovulum agarivorans]